MVKLIYCMFFKKNGLVFIHEVSLEYPCSLATWYFNMTSAYIKLFYSLRRPFIRRMGSIVSCGKHGSANISGSQSDVQVLARSMGNRNDIIEEIVCSESDLVDEGIKSVELNGTKILIAKTEGNVYAIGSKCTHYGLPLAGGSLCNGRIRCPFHGACFSLKTGDIEDFPGLDSIPKFDVEIVGGEVKVRANKHLLESKTIVKQLTKRDPDNGQTFIVVGGGAAGAKCVESLRQEGFDGRILLLTAENALPYDRPKISKAMHLTPEALALRKPAFYENADVEIKLGAAVTKVDTSSKKLFTSTAGSFDYNKLFLATGGQPRTLSVPGSDLQNIFVLRSPTDANSIVQVAKGKKVAIIGTSFIGMETAAYLSTDDRCESVVVIGSSSVPFERSLGSAVGERIQRWFEEKGITFKNNSKIIKLEGDGKVEKVLINDGEEVEAEVVVAGIGVIPSTEYLKDSGVNLDDNGYVVVNEEMQTNLEDVFCGGDIASFPLFLQPENSVSIGHWQIAHKHGHVAALNMLGKKEAVYTVPFFWTALFGKSLRYTGYGSFDDVIISGDLEELTFIAYYCQGPKVVGLASMGKAPAAANYANYLFKGSFLTKDQVEADKEIALKIKC